MTTDGFVKLEVIPRSASLLIASGVPSQGQPMVPTTSEQYITDFLLCASLIPDEIKTPADLEFAGEVIFGGTALERVLDASHAALKRPWIDGGRAVDKAYNDTKVRFLPHLTAIRKLAATAVLNFKRAEEEQLRKQRLEAALKEQERVKTLQLAREATTEEDRSLLHDIAKVQAQQAVEIRSAPMVVAPTVPGFTAKPWKRFRILNIHDLYKAFPEFVELTVKKGELEKRINADLKEVPGIEIYDDTRDQFRM